MYAHKSLVRIRAGVATCEGVSTGEVKAKGREQVRAKLEEQVHPIIPHPDPPEPTVGQGTGSWGMAEVGKIPEGPGQKQSREAAHSEDSPRPRRTLGLPKATGQVLPLC